VVDAAVDLGVSVAPRAPVVPWDDKGPLTPGETYVLDAAGPRRASLAEVSKDGSLDVDLSDAWAPFIFSESDGPGAASKPNPYRKTFVALANDQASPEEILMETPQGVLAALSAAGIAPDKGAAESPAGRRAIGEAKRAVRVQRDRNYLEAYGVPPSLSVLLKRMEEDGQRDCYAQVDLAGLAAFDGMVTFQSREQSKREYGEVMGDAAWVDKLLASELFGADATTGKIQAGPSTSPSQSADGQDEVLARLSAGDRKMSARIDRYRRGQKRLRAIRAVQARLLCEGLLGPRAKYVHGMFDLATNQALAAWERKNDIFGWGFLGGETLAALQRPPMELHLDTFRRILMERIADGAGILEDGSGGDGKTPATFKDADGVLQPVPNLIADNAEALMAALTIKTWQDVETFLRRVGQAGLATLHVAFRPAPLPPYYGKRMNLSVVIDRGDVWYDFPFDEAGKPVNQLRINYPTLTVFVDWQKQKIPLVRWRTTIGSWRSEVHRDGKVYYKYKNSDVGPRIWKDIVASPVWIPPDSTPPRDLLTRKTLDRDVGPVTVDRRDGTGLSVGLRTGHGHPPPWREQSVRQRHSDPRLGGLHLDRTALLPRLPPHREQPRGAPVRLHPQAPRFRPPGQSGHDPAQALHPRRQGLRIPARHARLLLPAQAADPRAGHRGTDHGQGKAPHR
jgi:hypothetical protein